MNKFFVVKDPSSVGPSLSVSDMLLEHSTSEHARYTVGCGLPQYEKERHVVHMSRKEALEDVGNRAEDMGAGVGKVLKEIYGSLREANSREDVIEHVLSTASPAQIWAALRGKADLAAVVAMVRQDIEAASGSPGLEALCESLMDDVVRAKIA